MELKEPKITLFGRKIVLPENGGVVAAGEESSDEINDGGGDSDLCIEGEKADEGKQLPPDEEAQVVENSKTKQQETDQNPNAIEESKNPNSSSEFHSNPKPPPVVSESNPKSKNECTNEKQKTLKKPDKILPCPRCNSMDTKFCYYNNYNVNQPRHFCKSCQRYWTAGGTMRNVPVGAGRRKNKNSASHCRHITISEALGSARVVDSSNGFHHPSNGTILSFGPGPTSPLCKSASALDLADKRAQNGIGNGYHKNGEKINDSSVTTQSPGSEQPMINNNSNINGFTFPVPCVPWNFPWNSAVPLQAICPVPFYPTPYWNYNVPNTWNFPCVAPQTPNENEKATAGSGPGSPLGKHSRNGELINPSSSENKENFEWKNSESSIVVPKTLRIDDPEEAAKSSIWETLGIKYDSISREGLFKALQPKSSKEKLKISASPVLQANPAALSRSISFQEGA